MVMATLTMNVCSLALPIVLLQVYDRVVPNDAGHTLMLLVAGVGCALAFEAVVRFGRSYITGWAGACFEHNAGNAAVTNLLGADMASYEKEAAGVHLDRLRGLDALWDFYSSQVVLIFVDLPFAMLFLIMIGFLGGQLVYVPIVLFILFALTSWYVGRRMRRALEQRAVADDRRYNFIIEVLGGMHTIKAMAMEAPMVRRYERLQESCARAGYEVTRYSTMTNGLGSLFSQLTMVSVVAFGTVLVIDGSLSIGGLAASTLLAGRSLQPLLRASGVWSRYQNIRVAQGRFNDIFALPPESAAGLPAMPEIKGEITFSDVHFSYESDGPAILEGANLTIAAGASISICGQNGRGKSTILWLIMGALRPTQGQVSIDGYDLKEFDLTSLKRQIAYLPQQGALFQGTILENLSMFRGDEFDEAAMRAARTLGFDERITRLPMGYETMVANGSVDGLPGGIKQRITIARALVNQPPLILFDEANTSLDRPGDEALKKALEELKGQCTIVIVSHRPSLLNLADTVYELRDGHLVPRHDDRALDDMASAAQRAS